MIATYYIVKVEHDYGYMIKVHSPHVELQAKGYCDAARKSGLHGKLSVNRKGNFYSRLVEV